MLLVLVEPALSRIRPSCKAIIDLIMSNETRLVPSRIVAGGLLVEALIIACSVSKLVAQLALLLRSKDCEKLSCSALLLILLTISISGFSVVAHEVILISVAAHVLSLV